MTIKDYFATTTRQMATMAATTTRRTMMAATTTRRAMMTLLVILLTTATTAWADTVTLTFSEKGAITTIEAGKPYIIKWDESGTDLTESDLVFQGVSASSTAADVMTDYVDFRGTFSPIVIYESGAEKHYFYLGGDNMLYWPSAVGFQVRSCRAWFVLKNGLTAGEKKSDVRAISLDFGDGDETTGIVDMEHGTWNIEHGTLNNEHLAGGAWYTIDGRKLSGKPTAKGLYIHNGKKRIIK